MESEPKFFTEVQNTSVYKYNPNPASLSYVREVPSRTFWTH